MVRNGVSLLVFLAIASTGASAAQAQGYVYVAPQYWATPPVPVTVYRPIAPVIVQQPVVVPQPIVVQRSVYVPQPVVVQQPVYVPQPVVVQQPAVVQSAYYAPSVPVVAPVTPVVGYGPRYYRESYYNGPVVSRYNLNTYGPGPDYSLSVRSGPRYTTIRERNW